MWDLPTPPWAASSPPGQERHEDYYPGISPSLVGVSLFTTILSVIVVCMRLYSRIFIARGLKADDCKSKSCAYVPKYQLALSLNNDYNTDLIVFATGLFVGFSAICLRRESLHHPHLTFGSLAHGTTVAVYGVGTHIWDVPMWKYSPGILQVRTMDCAPKCFVNSPNLDPGS